MNPRSAYTACLREARAHYENFPVASRLLPARVRGPVAAIYVFARRADDMADEGLHTQAQRLAMLNEMERELDRMLAGHPSPDTLWIALADAIVRCGLPEQPLRDLLSAFRQDVVCNRYDDFEQVLAYCERSANPVGRLLLHLNEATTAANLRDSDAVCTALQLINFLQDLEQDFVQRDRLYLPQSDLARHGLAEDDLRTDTPGPATSALLTEQVERAAWWLYQGRELPERLRGRFAAEIRLIIRGGWAVVERLRLEKPRRPFARPRLRGRDQLWMARGLLARHALPPSIPEPIAPVRTRIRSADQPR